MIKYVRESEAADFELAKDCLKFTFKKTSAMIDDLVSSLWGWSNLPKQFSITGNAWIEAEDEIFEAARKGYWWDVMDLGERYEKRVEKFCDNWRKQGARKAA